MSHVYTDIFSSVLAEIDTENVKFSKMAIIRGKIHKYLGKNIDYSLPGKLILYIVDYIGNMLEDTPEDKKRE